MILRPPPLVAAPLEREGAAMNWDDLRFLVVMAREKTLAAASRRLGVDQTTVARRLRALEESLGAALFERSDGRWQLTAFGQRALERAERVEESVAGVLRSAEAEAKTVSGVVRITSVATIHTDYLAPRLAPFYARHPEVVIELVDSDENLNIARREADVAIRASRPESGDFKIRKLAEMSFAVYEAAGVDRAPTANDWLAYHEHLAHTPEMRWLAEHALGGRVRLRSNMPRALADAAAGGLGRVLLPCYVGDFHAGLRRSAPAAAPVLSRDVWMLVHRDARELVRVAVVADWLVEQFASDASLFRGRVQADEGGDHSSR